MKLANKKIVDHGAKLDLNQIQELKNQINKSWAIKDRKLYRHFDVKNFLQARKFVNKIADIADSINHHPDITFSFKYVDVVIYTHAIDGLSDADFILAAKIDLI